MAATNYRDKRFRKVQGGPITYTAAGSGQWWGETVMGSRHVMVPTPLVAAGTRVSIEGVVAYGTVNSGAAAASFCITSYQVNTGFVISTINSIGLGLTGSPSLAVYWTLINPRT